MSRKHKKRLKDKRAFKLRLKPGTVFSIAQITFFTLSALIIISFSRQGLILIKINDFLMTYLSWAALFLPFIFVTFGFFVSKFRTPLGSPNVIVGIILFFTSIAILTKSGILGRLAWEGFVSLVTGIGAFVILFGLVIVGLIIMFNTSIDTVINLMIKFFRQHVFSGSIGKSVKPFARKELKVVGGLATNEKVVADKFSSNQADLGLEFEQKLVSNLHSISYQILP